MQRYVRRVVMFVAVGALSVAASASAFDRLILGSKLDVANKAGLEPKRSIRVLAKESPSDIAVLSDPTVGGATLTVVANGGTSTVGTYVLDASGWKHSGTRYLYRGPTGGDGDPVASVTLSRSAAGAVRLRIVIKGSVGTQSVDVVPPNPGTDGGVVLAVTGGDRYCAAFGAGAGGTELRDTALQWTLVKPAAQPGCPSAASSTTTTTSSPVTTTTVPIGQIMCPQDPGRTIFAGGPNTAACSQFDGDQPSCENAFHIGGECGVASCWYDFQSGSCRGCGPSNLDEGLCQNTCPVCEGDPSRTRFVGGPFNQGCHKYDASPASCDGAFIMSGDTRAYTSCYYDADAGECRGCGPNNQQDGSCINSCPTCVDPARQIFAGGPNSGACHLFDENPALCAQAFHMSGTCNTLASCYYDYDANSCNGCGPFNEQSGACANVCVEPICGNGVVDIAGEQCDGADSSCGLNETCNAECQCAPCNAQAIPSGGGLFTGTTSGTGSLAGSCGFGSGSSPENIYAWTPSTSHLALVTTCVGSTYDTILYVRQGSCNGPELACNDDSCGGASRVQPYVTAGITYYIVVDGYAGDSGNYTLYVSPSGAFLDQ